VRGTIELILRLQLQTRRIVVIGGTADVDRAAISRAREAAQVFKERVAFEFWTDRSLSQLREEVRSLPSQTVVLLSRIYRDGAGEAMIPSQVAQAIVESANAPLYVLADTILGTGAVGGSVVDVGALGKRVGEIGAGILDGSPKSFPFEVRTTGVPIFDWRALKRWGISESRLPPGSTVRFRPPSMWEQYRRYIIGALAIIALQAGLIVGLLLQRARRHHAEKQLRESQEFMELSTSAADLGLWVRDLEHDELSANHRLRSLFGFGQNEVLRFDDVLARIHSDDRARVMTEIERTQKTAPLNDVLQSKCWEKRRDLQRSVPRIRRRAAGAESLVHVHGGDRDSARRGRGHAGHRRRPVRRLRLLSAEGPGQVAGQGALAPGKSMGLSMRSPQAIMSSRRYFRTTATRC
jgi:PAS domain-containing protein